MVTKPLDSSVLERNILVLVTFATDRVVRIWESIAEMVLELDDQNYTNIMSIDYHSKQPMLTNLTTAIAQAAMAVILIIKTTANGPLL